ncbi:hypothetical protein [Aurantimonas sp. 22II-16-19i]|uniref:hypothetical protein n=1 Tax=Aurantimonas sp. 22II-16-19i TaxID=1317114 RepID=UPI00111C6322|nr:hypothetical protein [Aurantimonas sp. 22II-16-19i]
MSHERMLLRRETAITVPMIGQGAGSARHPAMRERSVKLLSASLVALSLLAGCGVKNLPVGPTTGEVPPVVATSQSRTNSRDTAGLLKPTSLTASNKNLSISAAEVSRNKVPPKPFVLDPLLN